MEAQLVGLIGVGQRDVPLGVVHLVNLYNELYFYNKNFPLARDVHSTLKNLRGYSLSKIWETLVTQASAGNLATRTTLCQQISDCVFKSHISYLIENNYVFRTKLHHLYILFGKSYRSHKRGRMFPDPLESSLNRYLRIFRVGGGRGSSLPLKEKLKRGDSIPNYPSFYIPLAQVERDERRISLPRNLLPRPADFIPFEGYDSWMGYKKGL